MTIQAKVSVGMRLCRVCASACFTSTLLHLESNHDVLL